MSHRASFQIYTRARYIDEIVSRIQAAGKGDTVSLATMAFRPDTPDVARIMDALCAAAQQGATTQLFLDAYVYLLNSSQPGSMIATTKIPSNPGGYFHTIQQTIDRLRAAGVVVTIINIPERRFANPFGGRSHIKFGRINNYVYLGGANLDSSDKIDVMVGREDPKLAEFIGSLAELVTSAGTVKRALNQEDRIFRIDSHAELLIDCGVPKQSLILGRAIQLIDGARERIFMTSQYPPNDRTGRHLMAAHKRGVKIELLYNGWEKFPFLYNYLQYGVEFGNKRRFPAELYAGRLPKQLPFSHAKILVTEQAAMVGSHNLAQAGVNFGTAETTIYNTDADFGHGLIAAIREQIAA